MPRGCSRRFLQAARGVMMCGNDSILAWQDRIHPTAGPELTLNSAPWQGRLAEHCPVTASIPQHSIHLPTQYPFPRRTSVPLQSICPCSVCPQPATLAGARPPYCAMLCRAGPLQPCSQPQHPLAPCQGAAGVLIIFIPGAAAGVPTTGFWRCLPTETGTTGEPRGAEGGLGTGHAGSAVPLPRVLILLCPSSPVPLPGSAVPRMSCDLSQFQRAPVQPFPFEPCPG